MEIFKKIIVILLTIGFANQLMAQKILCYKTNLELSNIDKAIKLLGKECQGKYSADDMVKKGWKLDEAKVTIGKHKYNHIYIFSKKTKTPKLIITTKYKKPVLYDLKEQQALIKNVTVTTATINIPSLKIGQSGIVVHKDGNNSFIVGSGYVIKSSNKNATIQFTNVEILKQDALPTSKLKPQNDDIFILNHLYNTSLLIVPNFEAKKAVVSLYPKHIFLEEDFFASKLKIDNIPFPTKEDIWQFALDQQIGTIFVVAYNRLYILDAISMKVIDKVTLPILSSKEQVPFFTNITDIKKSFWNFFGDDKIKDYNSYYKKLLGL
jgi:hypothetical protein